MRHRLTPTVLFAICTLCATSPLVAQVRLVEAGIFCTSPRTGEARPAPDTVAGVVHTIADAPFDVLGRVVPLEPGLSFGIRTALKSDTDLPVRMVMRHPPMVEKGGATGGSYETTLPADGTHIRSFTFDYAYEMVPGAWHMEVWDGETLALAVEFRVVPHAVAAVEEACERGVQS